MILIISSPKDYHTQKVVELLNRDRHEFYLWDLSRFPVDQSISIRYDAGRVTFALKDNGGSEINLSNVKSVWWRRPQSFTMSPDIVGDTDRYFALGECHAAINGLWSLTSGRWMNPCVEDDVASRKVYQLMVAQAVGLKIPDTVITNDPLHAGKFIENNHHGSGTICKSFSATEQAWRETRLVKQNEIDKLPNVKYAPVIFQEYIRSEADLRITIVGTKVFPAAIYIPKSSYQVDFRMTYSTARIAAHQLPESVEQKLLHFMQELKLVYGAIDMRLTPEGEYIFLEVNTAGQWLFMEEPTGMPITQAVADWLAL